MTGASTTHGGEDRKKNSRTGVIHGMMQVRQAKQAKKEERISCGEMAVANGKEDRTTKRQKIDEQRKSLPMWSARKKLLEEIAVTPALIVVGETGSGKTTQIPRFLLDAGFGDNGLIACTQPRRVAAITVAQRVSQELGTQLGGKVGYTVRFDDCTSSETKIKYMTDGMLLREALIDPILKKYSVVILDEAHERTIATDILLGLLKLVRAARGDDFRLIVMSATLDATGFVSYFPGSKAVYVQGRQHPVDIMYTQEPQESYLDSAITTAIQIHCDESEGDVLVFLTGQDEIEAAERLIKDRYASLPNNIVDGSILAVPMYAALPPDAQMQAFSPAPPGVRKVIFSTNIAETSITIPGVRYVVDTGVVKSRTYAASLGADCLEVVPISKAQARQRSGRAGREAPGKCYRLFTEDDFEALAHVTEPEIKRANLASVVLQLKALGISDPLKFDFMDSPPKAALLRALELLLALGALDATGGLTKPLGVQLARLPVDPMFARCLLASASMGCSEEMLEVVSMVSCDAVVFVSPRDQREEAADAHRQFATLTGDHTTLLTVFKSWLKTPKKEKKRWCKENFINNRAMNKGLDIYQQLRGHLEKLNLPIVSCGEDDTPLRKALVTGLFTHAARHQNDGKYRVVSTGQEVLLHPSSVLHGKRPDCIVFGELVRTSRQYARGITKIEALWLPELVPTYFARKQAN